MQCVYVNRDAPTYIKVIYPTARDIAQAVSSRSIKEKRTFTGALSESVTSIKSGESTVEGLGIGVRGCVLIY